MREHAGRRRKMIVRAKDNSDLSDSEVILGGSDGQSRKRNPRIPYIESKASGLVGTARIGRVTYSRTFGTLYYAGRAFQASRARDSRLATSKSRLENTIGSRGHAATAKIDCTSPICLSRLMSTLARNIGPTSAGSPRMLRGLRLAYSHNPNRLRTVLS
jgi:hypothetical protein